MKKFVFLLVILCGSFIVANAQEKQTTKLVGQLVCSLCWFEEEDRRVKPYGNLADIKCAEECAENGLPQALAVEDAKGFTLYTLEQGQFQTKAKNFLEFVPKTVEIEGEIRTEKDKKFIRVNSLKVVKDAQEKPVPQSDEATLTLKDLAGIEQNLTNLRGRFVVLNFWATWCVPCKKEMPYLAAIQNDYAALGVQVVGATADEAADSAKVLRFVKETKMNFPVWLGLTNADMTRFGVGTVLPATVVISREGKIVWREIGIIKPAELRQQLDKLLGNTQEPSKAAKKESSKAGNVSLVPA
jgi:thiol-disulfide isomerase/thioredoxin